jgi:5-methylthioadenosine/S-adenosylhomocysteine deaminase
MTRTLLRRVDVITLDADGSIYRDAEVAIEDGNIVAVGAAPAGFVADETIDAPDHLVMPGFFNAHTHAAMTLFRGWAEDLPLDRWFNERIWPAESGLTGDDVYWGAALAAAEMIRGGTVGFADHYFYMDRVAQVALESGLRASLAWCAFGLESGEVGATLPEIAAFAADWRHAADGRISTALGPHSPYVCTPQFLARTAAVAARLGVGVHIHVAETWDQVKQSRARYDLTPVELLDRNGILDVPVLAAHAIYVSAVDIEILAAKQVAVVQCPTCHMKLGMGVTPVPVMQESGVNVALGTDGPASNNALSMLQEARHAALIQKLHLADAGAMPGDMVLRMATQAGAHALGFPSSGQVAPGYAADLILLDCATPRLTPRHDLVANVVYAAQDGDVTDVMVAGRWLMRHRQLLTLDEERIRHEAERRAQRLTGAAGSARSARVYTG